MEGPAKGPPAIESGREATSKAGRREQVGKLRSDNMGASRPAAQSRKCCGRVWLAVQNAAGQGWPLCQPPMAAKVRRSSDSSAYHTTWLALLPGWFCRGALELRSDGRVQRQLAPTARLHPQASADSSGSAASWGSQLARCISMLAAHHAAELRPQPHGQQSSVLQHHGAAAGREGRGSGGVGYDRELGCQRHAP